MVSRLARLNEIIIGNLEFLPNLGKLDPHLVAVGLGRHSLGDSGLLHIHRVLVVSHLEVDFMAVHP
jgi:hypothetical protein